MSRRVPPETVEIYESGESIKSQPKEVWPFVEAQRAHDEKRGVFRDKRRKLILFAQRSTGTNFSATGGAVGLSAKPGAGFIERHAAAASSGTDKIVTIAALVWTGKVLSGKALSAQVLR